MTKSGLRERAVYSIGNNGSTRYLTVAETWQRTPRKGPTRDQVAAITPYADQIREHLERPEQRGYMTAVELARHMISEKGFSVAYEKLEYGIPENILAFSWLTKLNNHRSFAGRADYVFHQFGVTTAESVYASVSDRDAEKAEGLALRATRYRQAAGVLMYTAVADVHPKSHIYITDHPEDRREGRFFNAAGFVSAPDAAEWGTGKGLLIADAGIVVRDLIAIPDLAFLQPERS